MTLIEVMFSVAILSIVMLAATAIFAAIVKHRREAERFIDVQSVGVSSMVQLESDLTNAGYRWPSAMFAVHVFNNAATLDSGGNLGFVIDQGAGCGVGGIKPGSDVIEIVTGNTDYAPGDVQGISSGANPSTDYRIALEQQGAKAGPPAVPALAVPFDLASNGAGEVVMMIDQNGEACVGRVSAGPNGSPTINVTMLDRKFNDVASKTAVYPNCLTNTTVPSRIYRMGQRVRYMVCQETIAGVTTASLYRQVADTPPVGFAYTTPPVRVQPGVEDLQVSARVFARVPAMLAPAPDCFGASGGGEGWCFCNESPTSACDLGADPSPQLTKNSWASWVSGLRVSVSALGSRPMQGGTDAGQLAIKDNVPAPSNGDGMRRIAMEVGLGLTNFSQVTP